MHRTALMLLSLLAVAACEPTVPDSASGVGFGDYNEYRYAQAQERAAREAQLSGAITILPPEQTGAPTARGVEPVGVTNADLAAAGIGPVATAPVNPATATQPPQTDLITPAPGAPLAVTAAGAAYAAGNNPGISDEQDFSAVSARETIQSDAERLASNRQQYQTVAPQAVPARPGSTGPDIVAYALQTSNPMGQPVYKRTFASQGKAQRNCAKYASPDLAQRAFLAAGGPQKDRYGIDPDGDGYACGWNPEPFRRAVGG
ncbi:hypothetical protein [Tropicimonas marinistellae]|uniref:hypothetical protein n=1 Tax=Tropicimonas marinistellae TaxID=1739787 RepID=UPI000832ECEF|nr:hypothetical protein [Tropicimonas marinistellae]